MSAFPLSRSEMRPSAAERAVLSSLLLHHVGQAVHCRSVGLLARLLRQGVERPVDLGVVGVEVHPLHLVHGLPLGEPIILRLSACHKKSLLS